MSLLFVDSFGHYDTPDIGLKWSAATHGDLTGDYGISTRNIGGPDSGGQALKLGGVGNTVRKNLAGARTVIVGSGLYYDTAPLDNASFWMQLLGSDAPQLVLTLTPDGAIQAYRQSTLAGAADILVGASGDGVLEPGVYAYVEVKATISAGTAGALEVRVNGLPVLTLEGVRTNATGSTVEQTTGVLLGNGTGTAGTTYFNNLYICDTLGGINNDFFGQVSISPSSPSSDGTYHEFATQIGHVHYLQVSGALPTAYVSSSVVGARDTYGFGPFGGFLAEPGTAICAVQVIDLSITDSIGQRAIAHMAKHGISEQVSAAFTVTTARAYHATLQETDPATGTAWTLAGVNATEFGIVVAS